MGLDELNTTIEQLIIKNKNNTIIKQEGYDKALYAFIYYLVMNHKGNKNINKKTLIKSKDLIMSDYMNFLQEHGITGSPYKYFSRPLGKLENNNQTGVQKFTYKSIKINTDKYKQWYIIHKGKK